MFSAYSNAPFGLLYSRIGLLSFGRFLITCMKKFPTLPQNSTTKGYLIAVVGTAIWSTTAIFIRVLNQVYGMPPMVVAFWRDFFVALSLGGLFFLVNRKGFQLDRSHIWFMLSYGLTLAIFNSLWTISVKFNGAAVSTVLIYSSAAFTAIYERWMLRSPLGWGKIAAIGLSLAGCILVADAYRLSVWQLNPLGILVGLLSGAGFTAYSLFGKKAADRAINSWTALLYSFVVASMFLLLFNLLPDSSTDLSVLNRLLWLGDSTKGWLLLILLALGPSVGGYGLYTLSLQYLSASVSNLIATLEPSMTAVLAYLFIGERFTLAQILGSIMILAGVVTLRWRERSIRRKMQH
ncbi:MAG TPA: EamA family transporter [Chloroflexi bacterium]|nr:EamA family transporter [Chloroflexota bacterium]